MKIGIMLILLTMLTVGLGFSPVSTTSRQGVHIAQVSDVVPYCQPYPAAVGAGVAYDYSWSGDTYIQSGIINETWYNDPMLSNWWENNSLGFCWDFPVGDFIGERIETAEIYLESNGNTTLWVDWLVDACDDVSLFLWSHTTQQWVELWKNTGWCGEQWLEQSYSVPSSYDNGSVFLRWELAKDCVGSTGNWIPSLYIDFITLYDSTDPPPISPLPDGYEIPYVVVTTQDDRVQVGDPAYVDWFVQYEGLVEVFCDGVMVTSMTVTEDARTGNYSVISYVFTPDIVHMYKFWLRLDVAGHPVNAGLHTVIGDSIVIWTPETTTTTEQTPDNPASLVLFVIVLSTLVVVGIALAVITGRQ